MITPDVATTPAADTARRAWWRSAWAATALVFLLALCARLVALYFVRLAALTSPEEVLGPDSRGYLRLAREIAARNFEISGHPAAAVGSYNAAPYYLFALIVRLGGDLLAIQVFNSVLGAVGAALAYVAARRVAPAYAWVAGLLLAFNPSLIVLSASGLLKDPSIVCAIAAGLCGSVVALSTERPYRARHLVLPWLLLVVALVYLRMSRFYVAAYLEIGLLAAAFLMRRHDDQNLRARLAIFAVSAALAGEVIPMLFGWPSSVYLLTAAAVRVFGYPLDPVGWKPIETGEASFAGVSVQGMVKRTLGPFVWIAPPRWDPFTLVYSGDYLLYPGTLLWYALHPYVAAGLWRAQASWRKASTERLWLPVLSVFALLYLAQYLLFNLSYRQREAIFPLLLLIAILGYQYVRSWRQWRYLYAAYWLAIAVVGTAHLVIRTVGR